MTCLNTTDTRATFEPETFAFIDALRGLAILAVILVHSGQSVAPASVFLQAVMESGARGVQLFYVASAMTLCMSWQARSSREHGPLRNFFIRRLFRIAPMFYLAIAGYFCLYGLSPRYYAPNGIEWWYLPLTALFLNGFHPETITSVVPGGWSIVVEMTFYVVLPFLIERFRSLRSLVALYLVSLVTAAVAARVAYRVFGGAYPAEQIYLVDALASLNFLSQLPVFIAGMLAYRIVSGHVSWGRGVTLASATLAVWIGQTLWRSKVPLHDLVSSPIIMGALCALFAVLLARRPTVVLVNPLTEWIGKLSFSMYLIHFAVLDAATALGMGGLGHAGDKGALLHYAAVSAVTAVLASFTYRWIERPGVRLGRRLITRLEAAPVR